MIRLLKRLWSFLFRRKYDAYFEDSCYLEWTPNKNDLKKCTISFWIKWDRKPYQINDVPFDAGIGPDIFVKYDEEWRWVPKSSAEIRESIEELKNG